jgi:hypothetical protein
MIANLEYPDACQIVRSPESSAIARIASAGRDSLRIPMGLSLSA